MIEHTKDRIICYSQDENEEGYLCYTITGNIMDIYEVYVYPRFRGGRIASMLTKTALEYARNNDFKVKPTCPFANSFIRKHPEYFGLKHN